MLIRIIAIGHRLPDWAETAVADYTRRMPAELRTEVCAVRTEHRAQQSGRSRNDDGAPSRGTATLMAREAERMRALIPPQAHRVALDERGRALTTRELAARLQVWQGQGSPVVLLIGGPDGLDPGLRAEAHESLSLSRLTLPHAMARVILAEQLYRAWSVNAHHPYHRD